MNPHLMPPGNHGLIRIVTPCQHGPNIFRFTHPLYGSVFPIEGISDHVEDIGTPLDDLQWSAVLRSVSGFEMYRKRHHGISPDRVVGFLVLDRLFPR